MSTKIGKLQHLPATDLISMLQQHENLDLGDVLRLIIDWLRPGQVRRGIASVVTGIEELTMALDGFPQLRHQLGERIEKEFESALHLPLYTEIGIFSRRGFMREFSDRLYDRLNPRPLDPRNLKDLLAYVFHHPDDARWVPTVPNDAWWRLFQALGYLSEESGRATRRAREEVLYALEMLSVWIAAEELEPEFLRLEPEIAKRHSAFMGLQRELASYIDAYRAHLEGADSPNLDAKHCRVLLQQCQEQIERFARRAVTRGSSISLTHLLERLTQTLTRIIQLLDLLDLQGSDGQRDSALQIFRELVVANARRNSLITLWQDNIKLLSKSITQQASETGEHYITTSRAEYFSMLKSGAGAGLIIAVMALIKIRIESFGFSTGWHTLWVSLNYALGFVLIHILHFTVATKQPAMTAAVLAAAIERSEKNTASAARLADLLMQVGRSQFVAVLGNVGIALPVAMLIGWFAGIFTTEGILTLQQVEYQLHRLEPFAGLALFHAAIAGIWLFLAGLISGFFDNRCAYLNLPGRLREHPVLTRVLSAASRDRLAIFVGHNYGALAGNFCFGILLGITGYVGYLLGLPLDIQHVAFGSANLGYAASAGISGFDTVLISLMFVLLIGAVNLWVSFSLALYVALRARGARLGSPYRMLSAYFNRLRTHPRDFLFPPDQ